MNTKSALRLLLACGAFTLCACTFYRNRSAATPNGNYAEQVVVQGPGGTVSTHGSDGASMVADNQQTARDVVGGVVGVAGVAGNVKTVKSDNAFRIFKVKRNTRESFSTFHISPFGP